MAAQKTDVDLAHLFDELFPVPEGVSMPMPRFGRTNSPSPQCLPAAASWNQTQDQEPSVPLQWIDPDLGIRVFIQYEAEPSAESAQPTKAVWAYVEGDDPGLAGKLAAVALLSDKGGRFFDRLIPLQLGPDNRCSGKHRFGTIDEVRFQLGSEKLTLDVFLME